MGNKNVIPCRCGHISDINFCKICRQCCCNKKCKGIAQLVDTNNGLLCVDCLKGSIIIDDNKNKYNNSRYCKLCKINLKNIYYEKFDNKNVCHNCVRLIVDNYCMLLGGPNY